MPNESLGANTIEPGDGLGFGETRFTREVAFGGSFDNAHAAAIGAADLEWFKSRIKGTILEGVGDAALLRQIHLACTNDTRVSQPLRDRSAAWLAAN